MASFSLCPVCYGKTWTHALVPLEPGAHALLGLGEEPTAVCPSCATASVYLRLEMPMEARQAILLEACKFPDRVTRANRKTERDRLRKMLADTKSNRRYYGHHTGKASFTLYTWDQVPAKLQSNKWAGDWEKHDAKRTKARDLLVALGMNHHKATS